MSSEGRSEFTVTAASTMAILALSILLQAAPPSPPAGGARHGSGVAVSQADKRCLSAVAPGSVMGGRCALCHTGHGLPGPAGEGGEHSGVGL